MKKDHDKFEVGKSCFYLFLMRNANNENIGVIAKGIKEAVEKASKKYGVSQILGIVPLEFDKSSIFANYYFDNDQFATECKKINVIL